MEKLMIIMLFFSAQDSGKKDNHLSHFTDTILVTYCM